MNMSATKQKLFALLLALCVLGGLGFLAYRSIVPAQAALQAAPDTTYVSIINTRFYPSGSWNLIQNQLNADTPYFIDKGDGGTAAATGTLGQDGCTAYFDAASATLYLKDFHIKVHRENRDNDNGYTGVYFYGNLKIVLEGENSIEVVGKCIYGQHHSSTEDNPAVNTLTIEESANKGSLTLTSLEQYSRMTTEAGCIRVGIGDYPGNIVINSGTIKARAYAIREFSDTSYFHYGIRADGGELIINGGTVDVAVSASERGDPEGMYARIITINGGDVRAASQHSTPIRTPSGIGIYINGGTLRAATAYSSTSDVDETRAAYNWVALGDGMRGFVTTRPITMDENNEPIFYDIETAKQNYNMREYSSTSQYQVKGDGSGYTGIDSMKGYKWFYAFPSETHHIHTACGDEERCWHWPEDAYHTEHEPYSIFKPISTGEELLSAGAGYYYLENDIELASTFNAPDGFNLCLNGYKITPASGASSDVKILLNRTSKSKVNICDCTTTERRGSIVDGLWKEDGTGDVVLSGGVIGIPLWVEYGTVAFYGGNIAGVSDSGVYVGIGGTFGLYGGSITGNKTTRQGGGIYSQGTVVVENDNPFGTAPSISHNTATGMGGGIYVGGGSLTIEWEASQSARTRICNNTAANGGGIFFADSRVDSSIGSAIITGNQATEQGGGLYFAGGTLKLTGGEIKNNTAAEGGGIYLKGNGLTVEKTLTVTDNKNLGGKVNNLFVCKDKSLAIGESLPGLIGVSTEAEPTEEVPVTIATNATSAATACFRRDDTGGAFVITLREGAVLLAVPKGHEHPACGFNCTGMNGSHEVLTNWVAMDSLPANASLVGNRYLTADIKLENNLNLTGANLCLNGYNIDLNGYSISVYGRSVTPATLNICDCTSQRIQYGYWDENGVYHLQDTEPADVENFTTFTGGVIYGGKAGADNGQKGGAILIHAYATVNLYHCNIAGNQADYGGGVALYGTEGDTAPVLGVYNSVIMDNRAETKGGGVYFGGDDDYLSMRVAGLVKVTGNTVQGNANNVDKTDEKTAYVCILPDDLEEGTVIGVTTSGPSVNRDSTVAAYLDSTNFSDDAFAGHAGYFRSDLLQYMTQIDSDKRWVRTVKTDKHVHILCSNSTCRHDSAHSEWIFWQDITTLEEITEPGYYCLTKDVELTKTWTVPFDGIHLCLNGHNIHIAAADQKIVVPQGVKLDITDHLATWYGYWENEEYVLVADRPDQTYDGYSSGVIYGGNAVNTDSVIDVFGTLMMYAGSIGGNKSTGCIVNIGETGTLGIYSYYSRVNYNISAGPDGDKPGAVYVGGTFLGYNGRVRDNDGCNIYLPIGKYIQEVGGSPMHYSYRYTTQATGNVLVAKAEGDFTFTANGSDSVNGFGSKIEQRRYYTSIDGKSLWLATPHGDHLVCGNDTCWATSHKDNTVSWKPIFESGDLKLIPTGQSGGYCLENDMTLEEDWVVDGTIRLCLNGHNLNLNGYQIQVEEAGNLYICDCTVSKTTARKQTGTWANGVYTLTDDENGTIVGGAIYGGNGGESGAIHVEGMLYLRNVTVCGNKGARGGICSTNQDIELNHRIVVTDNIDQSGNACNLYLPEGRKFVIEQGTWANFCAGANVGVTTENQGEMVEIVAEMLGKQEFIDANYIHSDRSGYITVYFEVKAGTNKNRICLRKPDASHAQHPECAAVCNHGEAHGEASWIPISDGTDLAQVYGGYYHLTCDVTLNRDWLVNRGDVYLCLNGFKLNLNGKTIQANNNFVLTDCQTHKETRGYLDSEGLWKPDGQATCNLSGGVIYGGRISALGEECVFTMYSVNVAGGNVGSAAIYVSEGSFKMYGGVIIGNAVNGVYLQDATFDMYDGTITNNKGSGVYMYAQYNNDNLTTFNMMGGTIRQNGAGAAKGAGVYCGNGTMKVSGTVVITDNADSNGTPSDVYLCGSRPITLNGELSEDTKIGIRVYWENDPFTRYWDDYMSDEDWNQYFIDNRGKNICLYEGELYSHTHEFTFSKDQNIIRARCSGDCFLNSFSAFTLYLAAPEAGAHQVTFAGYYYDHVAEIAGVTLEDIVYFQGEEQLASAPTAPGSYTASLTVTGGDGTNNTITLNYKIVLKITLDPGEGTLADGVDAFLFTDTAGKLTGELPAPTGGGCAFEGWYTEGGEQVTGETVFTQNTTVYASYQTHTPTQISVGTPATCTEDGEKGYFQCTSCSRYFADEACKELIGDNTALEAWLAGDAIIPAGHTYGQWIEEIPAQCTETGTLGHYTCSGCSKNFDAEKQELSSLEIPALNHTFGTVTPYKAETCVEDGTKAYKQCETCQLYFAGDAENNATDGKEKAEDFAIPATGHNPAKTEQVDANCTTDGVKAYWYCDWCKKYFSNEDCTAEIADLDSWKLDGGKISALGHAFADTFTVDKKASCDAAGSKSRHCSRCEAVTDETVIQQRTHALVDTDVAKNATCTENGTMNQKCSHGSSEEYEACTYTTQRTIPATGHTFGEITPYKTATCLENGTEAYKQCETCHLYFAESAKSDAADGKAKAEDFAIPATGHTFGEVTPYKAAKCEEDGTEAYKQCETCQLYFAGDAEVNEGDGKEEAAAFVIGKLNHDFAATFTVDKKASCDAAGSKSRHCSRCEAVTDETIIQQRTHNLVDTDVAKNATCTEEGTMNQKCSHAASDEYEACAYTTTRELPIDPANHASDEVEFLNVWTATCAAEGYTGDIYHACCGALKQAGTTVPRLAHTEATREENRVEATCGADGTYELVTYCQVCEEELSRESKSLPATGNHRFETEMEGTRVPATCVRAGTVTMQCSCGAETQVSLELNAENHEKVVTDAGKAPTCTAEGLTEGSHCEACGAIITAQTALKATGHREVQHEEKSPTCTEIGWNAYVTCERCDYTTYAEIPATGHAASEKWSSDEENHWRVCQNCTEKLEESAHSDANQDGACDVCGAEVSGTAPVEPTTPTEPTAPSEPSAPAEPSGRNGGAIAAILIVLVLLLAGSILVIFFLKKKREQK